MKGKDAVLAEIQQTTESMIQGSLTELTRKCGDPSCACATDPARRHGPHLYLMFRAQGKTHTVYVLPEQGEAIKQGHRAWLRFHELGAQLGADNRQRFLKTLDHQKQLAKAQRAKARSKA
jgi:hypothetical protein